METYRAASIVPGSWCRPPSKAGLWRQRYRPLGHSEATWAPWAPWTFRRCWSLFSGWLHFHYFLLFGVQNRSHPTASPQPEPCSLFYRTPSFSFQSDALYIYLYHQLHYLTHFALYLSLSPRKTLWLLSHWVYWLMESWTSRLFQC